MALQSRDNIIRRTQRERDRLREGMRRIRDQNYNRGYSAETYADAVLSGQEPRKDDDELAALERIYAGER